MEALFERSRLVFSESGIEALQSSHVVIAGVGGVGGFVAEALARGGVGAITLVDHDVVSPSNLNRQIIALQSTLGQEKVHVMKQRILDINPQCQVTAVNRFLTPDAMAEFLQQGFDFVVDAIDSLNCKVSLVASAHQLGVPVVSSMGAGRRVDPSKVCVADISQTHTCGLARNMRQRLRKLGIPKGIPVVFSTELPQPPGPMEEIDGARGRVVNGTASYMPGVFGLMLAGLVIQALTAAADA
ncbi:MAG: tRNA threonylcarbamoyladenosine dehydratase [Hydrogenovibrio sp.]